MDSKELARAAAKTATGHNGQILLCKNADFDSLILQWEPSDMSEPEQYLIASLDSVQMAGDTLRLTDETATPVFECHIDASPLPAWSTMLKSALEEQFPTQPIPDEATARKLLQEALSQYVGGQSNASNGEPTPAAPQRSLNDYLTKTGLEKLLSDEEVLKKLGEHVPKKALAHRSLKETLHRITRSAEFRNAGDELTRALLTPDYGSIFQLLEIPIPPADMHFKNPVESLLTALIAKEGTSAA